jgi:aminobenzoyl-glutamate utilization protein B
MKLIAALALAALIATGAQAQSVDAQKKAAFDIVDRNAKTIADIGDAVYYFGEPGMQEIESTKLLKATMEAAGFKVELGGAGMPTNFWASWGSGHPVIAISTEIDSLPLGNQTPMEMARKPMVPGAPGHMEGHNTHAGLTLAAMYAVKNVMEQNKLPGTIILSLGPAEEQLASRPFLVRQGYFKDVDAALIVHIGDNSSTGYGLQSYAAISAIFTFHGKTAHAAINPWDGKDAVDAVELMDIGFDKLREHMRPTYRAHRSITMGGVQPNIIADTGQIWWFVRDSTGPAAKANFDRLVDVGKGAALMTGTTMDMEVVASAWPALGNKVISEAIQKNIDAVGMPAWTDDEQKFAHEFQKSVGVREVGLDTKVRPAGPRPQTFASNDNGDVTWVVPTGLMSFPASVPGIQYHNWVAAVTPTSTIAHKGMVTGAKVMAASMLDLLTSPELLAAAKEQFKADTKDTPYFTLLPPEAKPQIDLNKEMMEKFRPAMAKYYLKVAPRFN